ncbi:hypothetical protein QOT17_017705 [Balamuthia mandrillaris]
MPPSGRMQRTSCWGLCFVLLCLAALVSASPSPSFEVTDPFGSHREGVEQDLFTVHFKHMHKDDSLHAHEAQGFQFTVNQIMRPSWYLQRKGEETAVPCERDSGKFWECVLGKDTIQELSNDDKVVVRGKLVKKITSGSRLVRKDVIGLPAEDFPEVKPVVLMALPFEEEPELPLAPQDEPIPERKNEAKTVAAPAVATHPLPQKQKILYTQTASSPKMATKITTSTKQQSNRHHLQSVSSVASAAIEAAKELGKGFTPTVSRSVRGVAARQEEENADIVITYNLADLLPTC